MSANPTPPEIAEDAGRIIAFVEKEAGHAAVENNFDDDPDGGPLARSYRHIAETVRTLLALLAQREQERDEAREQIERDEWAAVAALSVKMATDKLQARLDALEAALRKYGQHGPEFKCTYSTTRGEFPCDCGFAEILAALTSPSHQPTESES